MDYKYPRTPHLPYSPGTTSDDRKLENTDHLEGKEVVISIKMDGENTTCHKHGSHARSLTSVDHESRHWFKQFHSRFAHDIPEGMRICGENLYAKHTLAYKDLLSYFMAFSVWVEEKCLSWDETLEWLALFDIVPVQVVYRGIWNEELTKKIIAGLDLSKEEGIVIRLASAFNYDDFDKSICKWVRKDHVGTSKHWRNEKIIPNKLRADVII